jgi:hypothetical protein
LGGTDRLNRGIGLFKKEMEALEDSVRHSVWWIDNLKLDLATLEKDFDANDPQSYTCVLEQTFKKICDGNADHDEPSISVAEIANAQNEVTAQMKLARTRLAPQITELKSKLDLFEKLIAQVPPKLAEYRAAIQTREGIAGAQLNSIKAGYQYNQHQLLMQEIRSRGPKFGLKPVADRGRRPEALPQVLTNFLESQAVKWHDPPKKENDAVKWHTAPKKEDGTVRWHNPPKAQSNVVKWHTAPKK